MSLQTNAQIRQALRGGEETDEKKLKQVGGKL
jgi:hypothetical protein